jgi:hypothetical protein
MVPRKSSRHALIRINDPEGTSRYVINTRIDDDLQNHSSLTQRH